MGICLLFILGRMVFHKFSPFLSSSLCCVCVYIFILLYDISYYIARIHLSSVCGFWTWNIFLWNWPGNAACVTPLNLYVCFPLSTCKFHQVRGYFWFIYFAPTTSMYSSCNIFLTNVALKKSRLGAYIVWWDLTACDVGISLSSSWYHNSLC